MNRRKMEEFFFKALMLASTIIVVGSLVIVFGVVILKGALAINLQMLTQTPSDGDIFGGKGGILNAIVGSLYLAGGATAVALLFSFVIILYLHGYAGRSKIAGFVRLSLDVLWGIPSIVFGAFAFIIMIWVGARASLFWGMATVALFELPIMTRAMDEVMKMVPFRLKEASYALGSTKLETVLNVMAKQALPGILTAVLLAFSRGIGDAASVLFTAGYSGYVPASLSDPVATLPVTILLEFGFSWNPAVQQRAYASAVVLLALVLFLSVVSRLATRKFTKYVIK